jgi:hypothetical protein
MRYRCVYHSFWLDLKILIVFLDLRVDLRGVGGETVCLSREIRRDGMRKLPLPSPTFASLHDRHTEPILHRTGYSTEMSCSRELCWPNLVHSKQRTQQGSHLTDRNPAICDFHGSQDLHQPTFNRVKDKIAYGIYGSLPFGRVTGASPTFRTPNPPGCVLYQ